jgi:hypothetical protein
MINPFQTLTALCRHFEQRYVPWPLLVMLVLTLAAFVFGYVEP